jgi:hypothetical protein
MSLKTYKRTTKSGLVIQHPPKCVDVLKSMRVRLSGVHGRPSTASGRYKPRYELLREAVDGVYDTDSEGERVPYYQQPSLIRRAAASMLDVPKASAP